MDTDPGTRQPDRDAAPDTMDTSIDAKSTKNTQHNDCDQPERAVKPTTPEDQFVPPVPSESKDRDDLATAQEQSGKPPSWLSQKTCLVGLDVDPRLLSSSQTSQTSIHPRSTLPLRSPAACRYYRTGRSRDRRKD